MASQIAIEQIIENLYDGLYFVDRDRRITYWNKSAERITGYSADEVLGTRCADNILIHVDGEGNSLCTDLCPLAATIEDGQFREAEVFLHHRNGHRLPVSVRVTPMIDDHGRTIGGIELFTDISSRDSLRLRIAELERLALLDPLTQLSNRRHIESQLHLRREEMRRYGMSFGVAMMDIDHFKGFNDQYGHLAGDQALRTVANTLMAAVRPFDTVGRWGGEEFVGIFPNVDRPALEVVAQRLRMLVEHSQIKVDREMLSVTVSVGATVARRDDAITSLMERADALMYESKRSGRNRVTLDI
jgi:diguanylate cyclase (GGDEF)-like protein/PAS domain S-box-containing protein